MTAKLSRRIELQYPFDIIKNSNYPKDLVMSVLRDNKVIIANKLSTYFILRKVQSEWTDFMLLYTKGTDYYVTEPKKRSIPYFFLHFKNGFTEKQIEELNRT